LADIYRLKKKDSTAVSTILKTKWKVVELNGKPIFQPKEMKNELFLQLNSENQ
jgi:hypothetical protein